jgi:Tol biopolymer transport system component
VLSLLVATTAGATTVERLDPGAGGIGPGPSTPPEAAPLPAPPGRTFHVSRKSTGQPFPNGGSLEPSASADGRFVAFTSIASDLVRGDQPGTLDVFVVDRQTGRVTRAPRPPSNGEGIGSSSEPAISADGNVVAFTWQAPVAAPPPPPTATPTPTPVIIFAAVPQTYVYAWDRRTNQLQPVSASSRGGRLPGARQPSISADGRYVAYTSSLDFGNDKDNNADDVFWFDRRTNETRLVSAGAQDHPIAGSASAPSISGDGNLVAFVSDGGDTLVNRPTGEGAQVYVRDMSTGRVDLLSAAADGGAPNGRAGEPAISQDGKFLAFTSNSSNLTPGSPTQVAMVYRRELATGATVLVSVQPNGAPSAGAAGQAAITADGGMVAFVSAATDLDPTPAGRIAPAAVARGASDVYIRDMAAGDTILASITLDRAATGTHTLQPAVAGQGRYVFFASDSDRLVLKDGNEAYDVFVRDLPPTPVLTPPTLDLGAQAVGTESGPGAATLANAGWSPLRVTGSAIAGANSKDFQVVADGCKGRTLKRNEACTVTVTFKPNGKGGRSATLNITDNLVTSRLAVALRGRASDAKVKITPAIGQPGTVVIVEGSGFPDGARVTLRWSTGITPRMDPVKAPGGRFRVPVLIFHNDVTGPRDLLVAPADGKAFPALTSPVLVTQPSVIPPTFLVAPRFVDLPLVLVIR